MADRRRRRPYPARVPRAEVVRRYFEHYLRRVQCRGRTLQGEDFTITVQNNPSTNFSGGLGTPTPAVPLAMGVVHTSLAPTEP